jgi:hypothetical protein
MLRTRVLFIAVALLSAAIIGAPMSASAQGTAPAATGSKKLTREKLREMRAKWQANKPKLKACRAESRKKGLAGDDRWFFIEDCMAKS